jgi:hypothetical protein
MKNILASPLMGGRRYQHCVATLKVIETLFSFSFSFSF